MTTHQAADLITQKLNICIAANAWQIGLFFVGVFFVFLSLNYFVEKLFNKLFDKQ